MLNRRRRRREEFEADRALGRIVAICATVLTVPAFAPAIEQWADLALWWSIPALTVVAGLLLLAVFGRELPPRLTTALWLVLPLAVLALLLLGYAAYSGTANNGRFPWVWWFAPGTSALVALAVRPASAVALTTLGAFAPALSYLVFRGEANLVLVGAGMLHLSDLALVLIVIATRERLHSLFEAEARALRSHVRSLQARARKLKAESRARLVHDEVLQTLIAAGRVPQPSPDLAAAASRSLAALAPHSAHPPSAQEDRLPNDVAARRIATAISDLSPRIAIEQSVSPGEVPRHAVEALELATSEAVRNALRHCGRRVRVDCELLFGPGGAEVHVHDDGPGFRLDQIPADRLGVRGSVLSRMRDLPGGWAHISSDSTGTTVELAWRP